ncbi:unnamed protein product [Amoebophrya sp. A25]|nr:unnamed protein product [Amoebophrya sp. A25]|eukprot:GSA25T00009068001.1
MRAEVLPKILATENGIGMRAEVLPTENGTSVLLSYQRSYGSDVSVFSFKSYGNFVNSA